MGERVRRHWQEMTSPGFSIRVHCQFRVATYQPGETLDGFIERADQALYDAKMLGKNQVVVREDTIEQLEEETRKLDRFLSLFSGENWERKLSGRWQRQGRSQKSQERDRLRAGRSRRQDPGSLPNRFTSMDNPSPGNAPHHFPFSGWGPALAGSQRTPSASPGDSGRPTAFCSPWVHLPLHLATIPLLIHPPVLLEHCFSPNFVSKKTGSTSLRCTPW